MTDTLADQLAEFAEFCSYLQECGEEEQLLAAAADQVLDVPDVRQRFGYDCGAACSMSVALYHGVAGDRTEADFIGQLGTDDQGGTKPSSIVRWFQDQGLTVEAREDLTLDDLFAYWQAGWPVIVPIQDYGTKQEFRANASGHYVVVCALWSGYVIVQDPSAANAEAGGRPPVQPDSVQDFGKLMIRLGVFDAVWHDVDANGELLTRYGIAVGPPVLSEARITESKDAQGHEHKGSGPGGGQFTSEGGGGGGGAGKEKAKKKDDKGKEKPKKPAQKTEPASKETAGKTKETETTGATPAEKTAAGPAAAAAATPGADPAANRPSKPEERHPDAAPPPQPWQDPPPKTGKKGEGQIERPKGDQSQTALGDHTEAMATQLGFRNILPEGKRTAAGTEDKHGSIDLEYDHSGKAYELKMCKTTSTEYRLKAKASEKAHKEEYAKKYELTPHTLIGVRDVEKNEVHFYASKEPGFTGAEVNPDKFHYIGTVKF